MPDSNENIKKGENENPEDIQEIATEVAENLTGDAEQETEHVTAETQEETQENTEESEEETQENTEESEEETQENTEESEEENETDEAGDKEKEDNENSDSVQSSDEDVEEVEHEILNHKLTDEQIEEIREFLKKPATNKEEANKTIEEMVKLLLSNHGTILSTGLFQYKTWEDVEKDIPDWASKMCRFNVSYPLESMLVRYLIDNKTIIGF